MLHIYSRGRAGASFTCSFVHVPSFVRYIPTPREWSVERDATVLHTPHINFNFSTQYITCRRSNSKTNTTSNNGPTHCMCMLHEHYKYVGTCSRALAKLAPHERCVRAASSRPPAPPCCLPCYRAAGPRHCCGGRASTASPPPALRRRARTSGGPSPASP